MGAGEGPGVESVSGGRLREMSNPAKQILSAASRPHAAQRSFRLHRGSGLALALYLPIHFVFLSEFVAGGDATGAPDSALGANPWVAGSQIVLVALLCAHLVGGIRVMLVSRAMVQRHQQRWLAAALIAGVTVAAAFAIAALGSGPPGR